MEIIQRFYGEPLDFCLDEDVPDYIQSLHGADTEYLTALHVISIMPCIIAKKLVSERGISLADAYDYINSAKTKVKFDERLMKAEEDCLKTIDKLKKATGPKEIETIIRKAEAIHRYFMDFWKSGQPNPQAESLIKFFEDEI